MKRSLRREFLVSLIETSRHLRHHVDIRARRLGLTGAQVRVLSRLRRREGVTQAELAFGMEMRPISIGSLIDKLARQGLVERRHDEKDRRINRIHLSETGRAVAQQLDGFREAIAREVLNGIEESDLLAALDVLSAVKATLKNCDSGAIIAAE
jgi:MarR family transcriptional regulator, transcriptional regulator for hemolysin